MPHHAPGVTTSAGPPIGDKQQQQLLRGSAKSRGTPTDQDQRPEAEVVHRPAPGAADVADRDGRTALHFACHSGHSDVVASLILAGCDVTTPDFAGYTALQRAAAQGHTVIVQQLLKQGAQVDHQDDVHGNTALHEAGWKGFSQTVDTLCKAKANAYIRNKGGFVPLHLVCQNGHNQSCRVLLWSGCRPDIKNNYGDTPLHTAARYGHAGVMRILISAHCSINEKNKNGDTAIHISSAMGRRKLTRILLESGCDRYIENKQGETAMDIARRKRFAEVGNILANPPPLRNTTEPKKESEKQHKKREKVESGTSKDSKDSGSRHKSGKTKKSKRGHKGHHHHHGHHQHHHVNGHNVDARTGHGSPYGCQHYSAGVMPIQNLKLDTLPDEPLVHGEQYFLDLAGNIKKGPVAVGYACYCVPFFRNVEKKMENDKQELMEHIDLAHDNLNAKITHLERRTRSQLTTINEGMKERIAADKAECLERVDRAIGARRSIIRPAGTSANDGSQLMRTPPSSTNINGSHRTAPVPTRDDVSSTSEEEEDEQSEEEDDDQEDDHQVHDQERCRPPHRRVHLQPTHLAAEVALAVKASKEVHFGGRSRSRSEEVLSDSTRAAPARTTSRSRAAAAAAAVPPPLPCRLEATSRMLTSPANLGHDPLPAASSAAQSRLRHPGNYDDVTLNCSKPQALDLDQVDRDSGYTTKLHSSFESASGASTGAVPAIQVPNLPPRTFSAHRCPPVGSTAPDYRGLSAEFSDIDGRFFVTVNNETEKWYERRRTMMAASEAAAANYDLPAGGVQRLLHPQHPHPHHHHHHHSTTAPRGPTAAMSTNGFAYPVPKIIQEVDQRMATRPSMVTDQQFRENAWRNDVSRACLGICSSRDSSESH